MHAHQPDGIFTGVLKFLGWEEYSVTDSSMGMYTHFIVTPPTEKQTTLQALLRQMKETVGINGVCVLRDADKVAMVVKHLYALPERS